MHSENEMNLSDHYETLPEFECRHRNSPIDYLSARISGKSNSFISVPTSPRDGSYYNSDTNSPKRPRRKCGTNTRRIRYKISSLSQSYYKTMSWISASSLQTGPNHTARAQSSVSCCSSPYKSNLDISTTSLHYQETRDVILTKDSFEKFGIKINRIGESFYISMIVCDSPAAKAGLKVGDEIIRVNNQTIDRFSNKTLIELIKNNEREVKISFKPRLVIARLRLVILKKVNGKFGIRIQRRSEGIYFAAVLPNSSACQAGIKEGDEILKINDEIVSHWSQEEVTRLLREVNTDESELVFYIRQIKPVEDFRIISHLITCRQNCLCVNTKLSSSRSMSPYEL